MTQYSVSFGGVASIAAATLYVITTVVAVFVFRLSSHLELLNEHEAQLGKGGELHVIGSWTGE